LALVAVALGGVSLVLSQVPYGRGGAAAVASLGLLLGIGGLSVARRKRVVGALGGLLNGAALAVMIALPSWLGWPSWWPAPDADDSRTVKAVRYDGSAAEPAEWVDVATASWQLRDVRVTVSLAAMGPVELTGPEQKRRWTREDYLQVWVRVENVGVARRVDCQGWGVPPPGVLPRLTNAAGKVLAAQALTGEFQPAGRPRAAALFPGKQADYLLIFELPSDRTPFLRLELPGAAFGGTEAVKLHIPRSSLIAWSAP